MTRERTSVLFVCLGNICRSPLAEGIFRRLVAKRELNHEFEIDSAGTGDYHLGEPPDPRAADVARIHGITLTGTARALEPKDFERFDYIIAMDRTNLHRIQELQREYGAGSATLSLLREFDPEAKGDLEVPDPYYGGAGGFERVYRMIERSCRQLLSQLTAPQHAE
ncbi:MAG: low molecular weight phosphotyrosine protein phosphatase [Gemmatimonadetes bacterium]|nr:low molecular weight phosphotyrosine protein phosphatase [Gemmatimonadota bacterium]